MAITHNMARSTFRQAELARLPDRLIKFGIDCIVSSRLSQEGQRDPEDRMRFWEEAWRGPIALSTEMANRQHYEVPAEFFDLVLGPRRKYSSAWWPEGVVDLAGAEAAMLDLYAERAGLADGQSILELGCGWGSFTLWAAERFPHSEVVGLSNSSKQKAYIEAGAVGRGLSNVRVVTADINEFDPRRRFDRVVSVEMLEHVRNHRLLLRRMTEWLEPGGVLFTHVFAHRTFAYPFEAQGAGSWMARTFFTDGVMPSPQLLPLAAAGLWELDGDWWIDGTHYEKTLEAWLHRLDGRRDQVRAVLEPIHGEDVDVWIQRWRIFFMACAQMFGFRDGTEWGVAHQRLVPVS